LICRETSRIIACTGLPTIDMNHSLRKLCVLDIAGFLALFGLLLGLLSGLLLMFTHSQEPSQSVLELNAGPLTWEVPRQWSALVIPLWASVWSALTYGATGALLAIFYNFYAVWFRPVRMQIDPFDDQTQQLGDLDARQAEQARTTRQLIEDGRARRGRTKPAA